MSRGSSPKIHADNNRREDHDDIMQRLEALEAKLSDSNKQKIVNNTVADNHTLDDFYKKFEDKFRGSEDLIAKRLHDYDAVFSAISNPDLPVIDIGCGRGEFLGYAKKCNLKAIGVDMNKSMVLRAKELGYTAIENDALTYLKTYKSNSLAAVVGFHIVEHIPFDVLLTVFQECYRCIHEGGFALFETPNPENLIVGACNFYYDPSHIRPIPPQLLAFSLESVGFNTEIKYLHESDQLAYYPQRDREIFSRFYGPMDYAVIATKKATSQDNSTSSN